MNWKDWPIQTLDLNESNYPEALKKISRPPKRLYFRGKWSDKLFGKSLAIVGSRRLTLYGKSVISKMVSYLVSQKVTIISGFMYGTDSEAHQQAIDFGGQTVAVLGNGLNILYPPENDRLYGQVLQSGGLVISEYQPDFQPKLWSFPQRNRIVTALSSLGVLLIEAGEKSGALITARLAKIQNKPVFAIPGPITSSVSAGTNLLIQKHQAKMVLQPEDLLGQKATKVSLFANLEISQLEKKILSQLENESLTTDQLAKLTNQNIISLSQTLSMMSLKGLLSESSGKYFLP